MRYRLLAAAAILTALSASATSAHAQAQVPTGIPTPLLPGFGLSPNGPFVNQFGGGMAGGGLTSQQFGTILGLRALQGMGHHGVQTGVQNPIMGGYGSPPGIMPMDSYSTSGNSSTKYKSSRERRDAVKAEKAEQKRLAAADKARAKADKASSKKTHTN